MILPVGSCSPSQGGPCSPDGQSLSSIQAMLPNTLQPCMPGPREATTLG